MEPAKRNFLDALQLRSRLANSRTLQDAFDPPDRGTPLESFTFGPDAIRSLLDRESCSLQIEADIELSHAVVESVNQQIREIQPIQPPESTHGPGPEPGKLAFVREKSLRYRIELEILPRSGILRVAQLECVARDRGVDISIRPYDPTRQGASPAARLTITAKS
jgi:hypothetical protein